MPPTSHRGALLALLAGACHGPVGSGDTGAALQSLSPTISAVTWSCDPDAAEWSFAEDTLGWTGGSALWMTTDVDRVERHGMGSVKAAADGSTDHLELSLGVVSDWRYAVWGSTTGWRCSDEPDLSFLIMIYTETGGDQADCRTWGASADIWASIPDGPTCDTPLDTGTGDTAQETGG